MKNLFIKYNWFQSLVWKKAFSERNYKRIFRDLNKKWTDDIAVRAYYLAEADSCSKSPEEYWYKAEREFLNECYKTISCGCKK